jgi:hypothetical protein
VVLEISVPAGAEDDPWGAVIDQWPLVPHIANYGDTGVVLSIRIDENIGTGRAA